MSDNFQEKTIRYLDTIVTVGIPGGGGGGGGDASASNQILEIAALNSIDGKLPVDISSLALESGGNLANINTKLPSLINSKLPVNIDNSTNVYESVGTNVTANIKSGTGKIFALDCTNLSSSQRYLLLFDSTGATTGTPKRSYPVYANSGFLSMNELDFGSNGLNFASGITFGFSTTALTYTAGTASDCIINVRYS
jgi:hypothetical protein